MWEYCLGLALLINGAVFINRQLRQYDPKHIHLLLIIGSFSSVTYFILGFFIYPWYIPILGMVILPMMISFVHFKFYQPNLLFALKDQFFVIVGFIICTNSVIRDF
jgi:hypothetical protein